MQSLGKYNKGNKYLLCAIDLFSKYAWVIPIKNKKGTSIVNTFQKIMNKHNQKPTDMFNKQDVTVYLTYIKILKDLNILNFRLHISEAIPETKWGFVMNKHNQKPTDIFNKQDVTVYLTDIKVSKDLNILNFRFQIPQAIFKVL